MLTNSTLSRPGPGLGGPDRGVGDKGANVDRLVRVRFSIRPGPNWSRVHNEAKSCFTSHPDHKRQKVRWNK